MKYKILHIALWLLALCPAAKAQSTAETVVDFLQETPDLIVFSRLVEACGLQPQLQQVRDEEYEQLYQTGQIRNIQDLASEGSGTGIVPEHRYFGFTVFAESDATWQQLLGKAAAGITPADVMQYLVSSGVAEGTTDENYTDPANALYQFVTYHILPQRLTPDKLVIHYNELGHYRTSKQPTIAVQEFFTTLGRPRLLKTFESAESEGIYLNRFPILRNGRGQFAPAFQDLNDYHESGQFCSVKGTTLRPDENEGIAVPTEYITASNGVIYPIDRPLVCTENVRRQLKSQRMRFDLTSLLPEMANNDMRRPMTNFTFGHVRDRAFPDDYPYFDNLTYKKGTRLYYLSGLDCDWMDYQGDEFLASGMFDMILKLPPVPANGTYELRLGTQSNSFVRGMAQFCIGTDPTQLTTVSVVDMRQGGLYLNIPSTQIASDMGWREDTGDPVQDRFNDLRFHEKGFMKGPQNYSASPGSKDAVRKLQFVLRRVIWAGAVEADQPMYLRIRNVMASDLKQFFLDYIEWCPKEVYNNPETPEDIW